MQVPLEISFRDVDRSAWIDDYINKQVQHLEHFCDNIISCHVAVERPHRHQHTGKPFRVRVEVRIPPNKALVAVEEPVTVDKQSDLHPVIRRAFEALERQIKEAVERRRQDVKTPADTAARALVAKLFPEQSYGFIRTPEGREVYFHRHSVLHDDFERLEIGTEVRFAEAMGEMGPQATSVQIVNKPGARESRDNLDQDEPPPQ